MYMWELKCDEKDTTSQQPAARTGNWLTKEKERKLNS